MVDGISFRWRLAATLLLALMFLSFVRATMPVRLASGDDVIIQAALSKPDKNASSVFFADWSQRQGRFYFAITTYRLPYEIYKIRDPFAFAFIRATALFAQYALLGWLLARICRNEAAGWLCTIVAAGALHIPAIFYPVLSYPAYSAGSIALLLALHCYLTGVQRSQAIWLSAAACLHLYALLCHENFLVFTVLFPVLAWATGYGRSTGVILWQCLPLLLVSVVYACVYAGFRWLHPTTYDGTVFSFSLSGAMTSWTRQTLAAIPGFELFINRTTPYYSGGPLWKTTSELKVILGSVASINLVLALISALFAAGLAYKAAASRVPALPVVIFLMLATALPNLLPSLAQKYQENAHHRFYPYVYSFSSYCWGVAAATCLGLMLVGKPHAKKSALRRGLPLLALLMAAVFISAQASNSHVIGLLCRWYG
jgi:hypothetical protein